MTAALAEWRTVHIAPNPEQYHGAYLKTYLPSATDTLYLAFTRADMAGDIDAMRTIGRLLEGFARCDTRTS